MIFTTAQATIANYVCAALAMVILLTRVATSMRRQRRFDLTFWLVMASIAVVTARIVVVYYYLLYGTANDAIHNAHYVNTHDQSTVETGSKLSLVARVLIAAGCWLQICLLLQFYTFLLEGISWIARMIKLTWVAVGATFLAVVLATFLECRPFYRYWQIDPDPGSCVKGYIQILVQCISNIVLDAMLLIISYPLLRGKGRSWTQHLRVGLLFVLGTFCMIVTSLRLASIFETDSAQPTRSTWASVQMAVSTFVANAPTIYGDLKVAKRKKSAHSEAKAIVRRMSRPEIWGNHDPEEGVIDLGPDRVHTVDSHYSGRSSRKEWFDHLETTDDGQWQNINWKQNRPDPV